MMGNQSEEFLAMDASLHGVMIEPADDERLERLIRFSDLCSSAKVTAEEMNDTFLAYMVSMSIQAARLEMRPKFRSSTTRAPAGPAQTK